MLPTRKLIQALGSRAFNGIPSCGHDCLPTWLVSVSNPQEVRVHDPKTLHHVSHCWCGSEFPLYITPLLSKWTRPPTLNHIVTTWAKTSKQTKTFLSGMTFQDLEIVFQKPKAKASLCVKLNYVLYNTHCYNNTYMGVIMESY